jgi:cytochrome b6-f complex iron-sulfur subunit
MTTHPVPAPEKTRLDPEETPRRDFLGLAAFWSAASALAFACLGMARLPRAAVIPAPSKKFKVQVPENLPAGTPVIPAGRSVAVFRDGEGVYAISTVCTHLGCIVKKEAGGFSCPCHGSKFTERGDVAKGPAPAPLRWLAVRKSGDGVYLIDEGKNVPAGTREMA